MVQLHAAKAGVPLNRPTLDVDIVLHIETGDSWSIMPGAWSISARTSLRCSKTKAGSRASSTKHSEHSDRASVLAPLPTSPLKPPLFGLHRHTGLPRQNRQSVLLGAAATARTMGGLLVWSVITNVVARAQEPTNAIIADLAVPGVPAPSVARALLRGVSVVVADRRPMGDPGTVAAAAGQHGRSQRQAREALPPNDSGCHLLPGSGWYRVAAATGGVPAADDRIRGLRSLGARRRVATHP
ncbi:hypothetical protein ABH939_005806 [Rhodococcus sp. 27YEA6]